VCGSGVIEAAAALGAVGGNPVKVQVLSPAPSLSQLKNADVMKLVDIIAFYYLSTTGEIL